MVIILPNRDCLVYCWLYRWSYINMMKVCKYCNESKFLIFGNNKTKDYQGNVVEQDYCCCLGCDSQSPEHYPINELKQTKR